jgi:hypothetical protein
VAQSNTELSTLCGEKPVRGIAWGCYSRERLSIGQAPPIDQGYLPDQLPGAANLAATGHGNKDEGVYSGKRNEKHVCVPTLVVTG